MSGPVIGLCAAVERGTWNGWDEVTTMLPRAYADAVQRAGGLAILLPPDDEVARAPAQVLGLIDGLLLAGGSDVDPGTYGARPHPRTGATDPARDRFEIALAGAALERDLPVLGVCRGMQLLNVAAGGTLEQHVPDRLGHDLHRDRPGAFAEHEVALAPGSLAARAAGEERHRVKSSHHQAPAELGEGVAATGAPADGDGLVEAIELPARGFALGVLWHPEEDPASRVIGALVQAAGARSLRRALPSV